MNLRPESLILLLFFVMYMTFMIFCAQSKKAKKQSMSKLDSSRRQSESSADSAITSEHEYSDEGSGSDDSCDDHSSLSFKSDKTFSYEEPLDDKNRIIGDQKTKRDYTTVIIETSYQQEPKGLNKKPCHLDGGLKINEKTPLVAAKHYDSLYVYPGFRIETAQLTGHETNSQNNRNKAKSGHVIPNSFSVDLGIAIKNSTCLMKSCDVDYIHDTLLGCRTPLLSKSYNNVYHDPDQQNNIIIGSKMKEQKFNYNPNNLSSAAGAANAEEHSDWISSNWILVPMFPLTLSMKVLMPGKFKTTFWTIWSFLISVALIGALTYVSVWMVHLLGQLLGIPDTVAGMTILSWGTGIPELIASIVLIRKTAEADMAISNTIGSNIIDVSFCLSLPW